MSFISIVIIFLLIILFYIASTVYKQLEAEYNVREWEDLAHLAFYSIHLDKNQQIQFLNKEDMQHFVDSYIEVRSYSKS